MGERLRIEVQNGDKVLASAYYHWSAYTKDALIMTIQCARTLEDMQAASKTSAEAFTPMQMAVSALQATGAGADEDELREIQQDKSGDFDGIRFNKTLSIGMGVLYVTEESVAKLHRTPLNTLTGLAGSITIFMDKNTVDFNVVCAVTLKEFEEYWRDNNNARIEDFPQIRDFDFRSIPFDKLETLLDIVKMYPKGVMLEDGPIVLWL